MTVFFTTTCCFKHMLVSLKVDLNETVNLLKEVQSFHILCEKMSSMPNSASAADCNSVAVPRKSINAVVSGEN